MELRIMGRRGDDTIKWDMTIPESVEKARVAFMGALQRGCRAFLLNPDGSHGEPIHEFDAKAERIIIIPQVAGGL